MTIQITVPSLGESITEAIVLKWLKNVGDAVEVDDPLVELETDKVTVEVPAPTAGVLSDIAAGDGAEVLVGGVLGTLEEGAAAATKVPPAQPAAAETPPAPASEPALEPAPEPMPEPAPAASAPEPTATEAPAPAPSTAAPTAAPTTAKLAPAVRVMVEEHGLDPALIPATGKRGRLTKADVQKFLDSGGASAPAAAAAVQGDMPPPVAGEHEEVVKMSRLRQRIAERLKEAQNTAAILSTYNEVDMTNLIALRSKYRGAFEEKHEVRLGFLSFFIKASIAALREFPAVNAEIRGDSIIYKNHYDISVAVGTPQGLVVPVIRDADAKSFADLERIIADYGNRAREGKLTLEEMTGGTFTISNGGVYGSMLSMPILNPPQSGILGMHRISRRPMAVGDEIEIRDMMYLALSYDHRIVDGREAVTFLVRIKECLEDPQRLLIDL